MLKRLWKPGYFGHLTLPMMVGLNGLWWVSLLFMGYGRPKLTGLIERFRETDECETPSVLRNLFGLYWLLKVNGLMQRTSWIKGMVAKWTCTQFVLVKGECLPTNAADNGRVLLVARYEVVIHQFVVTLIAGKILLTLSAFKTGNVVF